MSSEAHADLDRRDQDWFSAPVPRLVRRQFTIVADWFCADATRNLLWARGEMGVDELHRPGAFADGGGAALG
jgi:hypothetical protein